MQRLLRLCLVVALVLGLAALQMPSHVERSSRLPRSAARAPDPAVRGRVGEAYGRLPLQFEANEGQTDPQVQFMARGSGYALWLTAQEAVLALTRGGRATVVRLRPQGGRRAPEIAGETVLPGKVNYFLGNDPAKWRTNILTYARVRYRNVYPGVDLVYHGRGGRLEYDFEVAPGADPAEIRLRLEGVERLQVDGHGDLVLHVAGGEIRQPRPVVYQDRGGMREIIAGGYVLRGQEIGFQVGAYDLTRPLIIDPVLVYSTYLGGSGQDGGIAIAVDGAGNAYVTGNTQSSNFPTTAPIQPASGGGSADAFVTKINAAGSAHLYSTYLGGSGSDGGAGIAVDAAGSAYITGGTSSTNFPMINPIQPTVGGADAFVTKINTTGSALVYSTYLGGSNGIDIGRDIAVDGTGNAYVAGYTSSTNFPTTNPIQPANAGNDDAFVTKINAAGSAHVYSTYLGGSAGFFGGDFAFGIAVDGEGNAYVTGQTESTDFPTTNPIQPANAGASDAFVTKINAAGSALAYSTYLGGGIADFGHGVAVDTAGNAYITGLTFSSNFPTTNPIQPASAGAGDAFVTKINSSGSVHVYSTYLGGASFDGGGGIAVDGAGNAYVTGRTDSTNFPTTNPIQPAHAGGTDAFVTKFNAAGSAHVYSTYLGGSGVDNGGIFSGIAVSGSGDAYVTGETGSTNFPTVNPIQPANAGGADAFVARISDMAVINVQIDIRPGVFPNIIDLSVPGVLPVAILTTSSFNAATVSARTVRFAGAAPVQSALRDVDGDGDLDLLLQFPMRRLALTCASTSATLTGQTNAGGSITGTDSVRIRRDRAGQLCH